MIIGRIKFFASVKQPKPNEVDYWIDLVSDPYGKVIRTWNGFTWERLDQETTNVILNLQMKLEDIDDEIKLIRDQINPIGTTELRPTDVNNGFQYFDITLNKPIWKTNDGWVDATGVNV